MGDWKLIDSMIIDGLWDVYNQYHMGITAENVAKKYGITREEQDALAAGLAAQGRRRAESGPLQGRDRRRHHPAEEGRRLVFAADEFINRKTSAEGLAGLRPAFDKAGSVTAGNASGLNDGAAGVVVMSGEEGRRARPEAAGAHRQLRQRRPRPGLHGHGPGARRAQGAGARRLEARRPGPAGDQRSLRRPGLRGAQGNGLGHRARSTSTAAPSPSATRSAPPAAASS